MFPPPPPWSRQLFTVGVTGTNGKTSTCAFIAAALAQASRPVLRITTVGTYLGDELLEIPEHYEGFLEGMQRCVSAGGRHAVIELTSEALGLGFAKAWPCQLGVFTNLTRDHLDAHGTPEHYLASKAQLFVHLPPGSVAVLNANDPATPLLEEILPPGVQSLWVGRACIGRQVHVRILSVQVGWNGTSIQLDADSGYRPTAGQFEIRAIGIHFAENAVAALATAVAAGVAVDDAAEAISVAKPPAGRFEVVSRKPYVVIDYAHTPDAIDRTLQTARSLCSGRLVVVFGAGGGRDQGKRQAMGAAAMVADRVVLTSDNPRNEDPAMIARQIRQGLVDHPAVQITLDRAQAIKEAVGQAGANDVVVIAGKGHETHQLLGKEQRMFSDAGVVRSILGQDEGFGLR